MAQPPTAEQPTNHPDQEGSADEKSFLRKLGNYITNMAAGGFATVGTYHAVKSGNFDILPDPESLTPDELMHYSITLGYGGVLIALMTRDLVMDAVDSVKSVRKKRDSTADE